MGTALTRSSKFLTAAANFVLGIAVQKGLEKLGEWLVEQVGEERCRTPSGRWAGR